jgi:hypothetical protein
MMLIRFNILVKNARKRTGNFFQQKIVNVLPVTNRNKN